MNKIFKFTFAAMLGLGLMSFTFVPNTPELETTTITQGQGWERLGMRKVNLKADHDEIPVTISEGLFTKVKFVVRGADIFVHNVKIVFGNGETKNIVINRKVNQGTWSKVIDLPGNRRIIKTVKMNYKTIPNFKGKAVVALWGKH